MAKLLYCEFAKKIYEVPDNYKTNPDVRPWQEHACCPACGDDICKPTLGYYHSLWRSQFMTPNEIRRVARRMRSIKAKVRRK